ncbi:MAG: MarR family transcriptional regulator [candidate division Zixibacteria bacterium]|nr:MarR family transcriptional regulator [candidate division Zixibacteria bacterium]
MMFYITGMKNKAKPQNQAQKTRKYSAGWMINMLAAALDASLVKQLGKLDLNINQFAILMTLLENEGLTQAEIGRKIFMRGFSTTRTLDILEKKKLVKRLRDEQSRRCNRIYLTVRGRKIGPKLFKAVEIVNSNLLSILSKTEENQFKNLLLRLMIENCYTQE